MDFFGAGSPMIEPRTKKTNYWLGKSDAFFAGINEALANSGYRPVPLGTVDMEKNEDGEWEIVLPEGTGFKEMPITPETGDFIPVPAVDNTTFRDVKDTSTDSLVVIRDGEVIEIPLNGRTIEEATEEEMAVPGTEAASPNRTFGENPPAPPRLLTDLSEAEQDMFRQFVDTFQGGLKGFEQAKEDFLSGVIDWLPTDFSYFNSMVPDESGMFQGGYVTPNRETGEGSFYTHRTGYKESYGTEPTNNPVDKAGNSRFVEVSTLDGRTIWTTNDDYSPSGTGTGGRTDKDSTDKEVDRLNKEYLEQKGVEGAVAILTRLVGAMGLPVSLVAKLKNMMVDGLSEDAIKLEIRQSDEYKARFPGMEYRRLNGFAPITEAAYMENEDTYYNLLRLHGLPERFYDDLEDFAVLIGEDVSPEEFGERVSLAELATAGADPFTKEELRRLYDVQQTDLVAYYLDPEAATNLVQERRAFEAAGLSASARRVTGRKTGFDKQTADALQREGIQRREIQQRLAPRAGLLGQTIGETTGLTTSELASGEFGLDINDRRRVERRRQERLAGVSGASGTMVSGAGATGFGSANT